MRVKTWDEARLPADHYLGTARVELTEGEREALALRTLLQVGIEVLEKRAALEEASGRLRHMIGLHAEGRHGHPAIPRHLMKAVLGPLYPPEVEQVRDGPEVAQEGIPAPEPEPGPLSPQDPRSAVEEGHPAPDFRRLLSEADSGAVGHQQHG